jgi:phage shock protein PspC (stress-responsive transcriptional regulator)
MNKTISIHIKGNNFIIEEQGYILLKNYIERLNILLDKEQGKEEIIEDIEFRIAELFQELLNDRKNVIEEKEVIQILQTLGNPEEYTFNEESESKVTDTKEEMVEEVKHGKQLYRDIENAKIAGVCSGISHYLKVDVRIIRACFLLIFFFGAFSIPVYLILWLVVPKAISSSDRLRMKGRAITVDTLKDEVEQAAVRIKHEGNNFAQRLRTSGSYTDGIARLVRLASIISGIFCLVIGLSLATSVFFWGIFEFSVNFFSQDLGLNNIKELFITDPSFFDKWKIFASITLISSSLFFIVLGIKLVVSLRSKWLSIMITLLFLTGCVGAIGGVVVVFKSGVHAPTNASIEKELISCSTDSLFITSIPNYPSKMRIKINSNTIQFNEKGGRIYESDVPISYIESEDSLFHVYQVTEANGASTKKVMQTIKNIEYGVKLSKNKLQLQTHFSYPSNEKLLGQSIELKIEIPKEKKLFINNKLFTFEEDEIDFELEMEKESYSTLNENGMMEW